jgi:peptidase E
MAAARPTIIATSIGFQAAGGGTWDAMPGPAYRRAIKLARAGKYPRLCMLATGEGDNPLYLAARYSAFSRLDLRVSHLALFPMPNVADIREHLLGQDIIWVGGGSTANLLALWRLHGLDIILRECWGAGVV